MTKYLLPLAAALLFLPACSCHKKCCSKRSNPPAATRCCPQAQPARPKCGCTGKPKCGNKQQYRRKVGPNRHPVSLSEVMDYLPGIPPGYWVI